MIEININVFFMAFDELSIPYSFARVLLKMEIQELAGNVAFIANQTFEFLSFEMRK